MAEIRAREWRDSDGAAIIPILKNLAVVSGRASLSLARSGAAELRQAQRGPSMAVCRLDDDDVLGKVALRLPGKASPATTCDAIRPADHPVGELSYWVLPHVRGRGVATAAAT